MTSRELGQDCFVEKQMQREKFKVQNLKPRGGRGRKDFGCGMNGPEYRGSTES